MIKMLKQRLSWLITPIKLEKEIADDIKEKEVEKEKEKIS